MGAYSMICRALRHALVANKARQARLLDSARSAGEISCNAAFISARSAFFAARGVAESLEVTAENQLASNGPLARPNASCATFAARLMSASSMMTAILISEVEIISMLI